MVCRSMLLLLDRAGQITLPPVSYVRHNPLASRQKPAPVLIDRSPIEMSLRELRPLEFMQVRRTEEEALFNGLMEEHHYLGYEQPVGEHLKYLASAKEGRPIACLAWSSAPRHIASRDHFIGWNAEARRRNIRSIAYNTRFLILPWVRVEHLASHILGRMAAQISADWQKLYGHPVYYLETFVDPERFRGYLLFCGELEVARPDYGSRQAVQQLCAEPVIEECTGISIDSTLPRVDGGVESMTRRIDVNLEELDHVLEEARQAPLSDAAYDKLKNALHALAAMVVRPE